MYEYRAKVERVVDGDTVDLAWIDLGFGVTLKPVGRNLRFRLAGIDAWETTLRGDTTPEEKKRGLIAKTWLVHLLEGQEVIVRSERAQGSFGRWLGWFWLLGQDDRTLETSVNMQLIANGHAVPYRR